MFSHKRAPAALAAVVCLLLSGCSLMTPAPSSDGNAGTSAPATTTTTAANTTDTPAAPNTQNLNRLTGNYDTPNGATARPVAVMIGNNTKSRPQYGLDKADLYVEAETEGGITRIMAVFADISRVPSQLGPIRSARSPFVFTAQALDAIYAHAGGSEAGLRNLANSGVSNINALIYDGSTFWRDSGLASSKGREYSMMTNADKLSARVQALGYRTTSDRTLFAFGDGKQGTAATAIQVYFSGAQTISFAYNSDSGLYTKQNGALGNASVHKTADGTAITAANVLVLYDAKYWENNTTINFSLKSGNGQLCSGGSTRPIRWSRTANGFTFTEEDGSPMQVHTGKTYICLVDKTCAGACKFQ